MRARIDREPGERASSQPRPRPAGRGDAVRDAKRRTHAVVDHALGAKALWDRQPVTERGGGAGDEDCGRDVLRVAAWIGAHVLLLDWGGRQNLLGDRLQARL